MLRDAIIYSSCTSGTSTLEPYHSNFIARQLYAQNCLKYRKIQYRPPRWVHINNLLQQLQYTIPRWNISKRRPPPSPPPSPHATADHGMCATYGRAHLRILGLSVKTKGSWWRGSVRPGLFLAKNANPRTVVRAFGHQSSLGHGYGDWIGK